MLNDELRAQVQELRHSAQRVALYLIKRMDDQDVQESVELRTATQEIVSALVAIDQDLKLLLDRKP